ncbi:MAG: hypothetical protein KF842_11900 [Caulobacter sp.]|nr:hypothetical protein [Caulobacter sp.]
MTRYLVRRMAILLSLTAAGCSTTNAKLAMLGAEDFDAAEQACRVAANAPVEAYAFAGRYQTATSARGLVINLLPVDRNATDRLISCNFSDWRQPPQVIRHQ